MRTRATIAALTLALLSGCVTKSEHERLLALAADREKSLAAKAAAEDARAKQQIAALEASLATLKGEVDERDKKLGELQVDLAGLQKRYDDSSALANELRQELQKAGKNVDGLMAEKGKMRQALDEAKVRLEELRRAQEAAQKRADLLKNLINKFKRMIESGDLKIVLRDGRMVLQLRNDVLFDSGKIEVKPAGRDALKDVAKVLVTLTDRKLQVVGHTDNRPIQTERFPSNWELSTSRAISVVKFLITEGVKAELLSAAGHSEHDPVATNDNDDGRAKNRRIEIVLQPNLSELIAVPTE
ncbi:MAG: OmpA family protein [Deltaproteobacteria bacterium]|nr:OmpA family protein [Deltaproteobacteria bacterium]